jgi:hypothetical protein
VVVVRVLREVVDQVQQLAPLPTLPQLPNVLARVVVAEVGLDLVEEVAYKIDEAAAFP